MNFPLDTGRNLNVHKTFRTSTQGLQKKSGLSVGLLLERVVPKNIFRREVSLNVVGDVFRGVSWSPKETMVFEKYL